jgi:hypothetical protein
MATVLEVYTTEEQRSVVHFFWTKELIAKDIYKEIFPVYNGKCLSREVVHNWVEKHGRCLTDEEVVEMEVQKWLRQQSKILLCCGV